MATATTDLKSEIDAAINSLKQAKTVIERIESERGAEGLSPLLLKDAKQALLFCLTKAHTKITEIIGETSNI